MFNFKFVDWTSIDLPGSLDDRKNASGICFSFESGTITWISENQDFVALSSLEAEYVPRGETTRKVLWLRKMLANFFFEQVEATKI